MVVDAATPGNLRRHRLPARPAPSRSPYVDRQRVAGRRRPSSPRRSPDTVWRHARTPASTSWQDIVTQAGAGLPGDRPPGRRRRCPTGTSPPGTSSPWTRSCALEAATEELWAMCLEAVAVMAADLDDAPARAARPARSPSPGSRSQRGDPSRLRPLRPPVRRRRVGQAARAERRHPDRAGGDRRRAVALARAGRLPDNDQWNSRARAARRALVASSTAPAGCPGIAVHFLYSEAETDRRGGDDRRTTCSDTAAHGRAWRPTATRSRTSGGTPQAGRVPRLRRRGPIRTAFKLYPWEVMLGEEFGAVLLHAARDRAGAVDRAGLEGAAVHQGAAADAVGAVPRPPELLLPSYFGRPARPRPSGCAKPKHGREGDNIRMHRADGTETDRIAERVRRARATSTRSGAQLPSFDGQPRDDRLAGSSTARPPG